MPTNREIYLDNNATTRVMPLAAQAAIDVMEQLYGNPSSSHTTGLRSRRILESARDEVKRVFGTTGGRIVFTSGATEAIETAVFSALCNFKKMRDGRAAQPPRLLLYGATEHKAVPQALAHWSELLGTGHQVTAIPVDGQGRLDLDFLQAQIAQADMVCTMAVNNETGVIHDLNAVARVLQRANNEVAWLVDCVQAIAKVKLNLLDIPVDYAAISGHKLYAPKGVGALYVRDGAPLTPLLAGGGQEGGARGGTENLSGVAAFAAVLRNLRDSQASEFQSDEILRGFRQRIVDSLRQALPGIEWNMPLDGSVPTTINFSVTGFTSKELMDLFDAAGIRVSSGSACGSAIQGSYVLEAMGLPKWKSDGAIRMSFGPASTETEIAAACRRIEEAGEALSSACLVDSSDRSRRPLDELDGLIQLKSGSDCSWILADAQSRQCVVIDPFAALLHRIETMIRCQDYQVIAVLDTHQHVDHESPRPQLVREFGERMLNDEATADVLGWPMSPDGTVTLGDDSTAPCLGVGDFVLAKCPLPGHTVDGVAFLFGQPHDGRLAPESVRFAFTGDTLLIGGIGRTDFHSSAAEQMLSSLRKLPKIVADSTVVCPTHDYTLGFITTLAAECRHNRLLRRLLDTIAPVSLQEFLEIKTEVDGEIDDERNCELVCGRIEVADIEAASTINVEPDQFADFLYERRDSTIVDVREPHEFRFEQNWRQLGFDTPPENVPLTRLADFFADVLATPDQQAQREIIFLCRSGNRSGRAAHVARRLGIEGTWNIAGGLALGTAPESAYQEDLEYAI